MKSNKPQWLSIVEKEKYNILLNISDFDKYLVSTIMAYHNNKLMSGHSQQDTIVLKNEIIKHIPRTIRI